MKCDTRLFGDNHNEVFWKKEMVVQIIYGDTMNGDRIIGFVVFYLEGDLSASGWNHL